MKKIIPSLLILFLIVSVFGTIQTVQASSDVWQTLPAKQNKIDVNTMQSLGQLQSDEMMTVIVTLNTQADLSRVNGASHAARQQGVIRALQATANATQGQLKSLLNSRKRQGKVKDYISLWVFNGFSVTAASDVITELSQQPEVYSISPDDLQIVPAAYSNPESNISQVNAPGLWSQGYTGQGVVIASMDSGVDVSHPDLANRWRGGSNSWFDPYSQHSSPVDLSGHGTWTTGIMVGGDAGGTTIGVAPDAKWIAVKIFNDSGSSTATAIHQGFQWLLDPDGNPGTADAPNVVNNSWTFAYPGCNLDFEPDLQSLRAAGILPVFAAGNGGPSGSTSYSPSNNPSAFAVGAVDKNNQIYAYSSRGPSTCGGSTGPYPELVAPGVNIRTTGLYGTYYNDSGTSFASPHVAGGLALLLSAYPDLSASDQEKALIHSALDLGASGPDDVYGYGLLNLFSALNWIASNPTPTPIVNLALNQSVTVSSYQDSAHIGAKAVDGDTATSWQTKQIKGKGGASSEWITVDLGSNASINEVKLEWNSYYATKYTIKVSEDASTWTTVFSTTNENGGTDTITLNVASARYVRLETTGWNDSKVRNWLNEFVIYGNSIKSALIDAPTPTPEPSPTPAPTNSIHVGDLDAVSVASGTRWNTTITVMVHDALEAPLQGVTVSGNWSNGASGSGSCTTGPDGTCSISRANLKTSTTNITFTITDLAGGFPYQSSGNHDPDNDSNGTSITVSRL